MDTTTALLICVLSAFVDCDEVALAGECDCGCEASDTDTDDCYFESKRHVDDRQGFGRSRRGVDRMKFVKRFVEVQLL